MNKNKFFIYMISTLLLIPIFSSAQTLRISENKRFLKDENGAPFLYLGDTAWELFHRLNREEADLYLKNRAEKGFSVIQAVVLAENDGLRTPNMYGEVPLHNLDPAQPNEAYFEHVDYIVNKAAELALFIGMLPTWGDKVTDVHGGSGPVVFTPENAKIYGKFLGKHYRDKPIIWILGGDRNVDNENVLNIWRAMAQGIEEGMDGKQLITYHPRGPYSSSYWLHNEPWLDFNMYQSGHGGSFTRVYEIAEELSLLKPVKPFVDGEPAYEDIAVRFWEYCDWSNPKRVPDSVLNEQGLIKDRSHFKDGFITDYDVRVHAYWNFLAGACGYTYGNNAIWQMYKTGGPIAIPCLTDWRSALDRPGSGDIKHIKNLFEARQISKLVADQSIIYGVNSKDSTHLRAAGSTDHSFLLVYAAVGQPFTVVMDKISGEKVIAHWYDPRTGKITKVGQFPNSGLKTFSPPSSGTDNDWLLLLDDASSNYPLPGPQANSWEFFSPDKNLKVKVNKTQNRLTYEVLLKSGQEYKTVIKPSVLGIERNDQSFLNNLQFEGFQKHSIRDEYQLITGKQKNNSYSANEFVLEFANMNGSKMQVIFRVFNDGAAFKYHFPGESESLFTIKTEYSEFAVPMDGIAWMLPYDSVGVWSPAYEAVFEKEIPVGAPAPSSTGWGFPALFSVNGSWLLLTESGVNESYCGSHLAAKSDNGCYRIEFPLETESYGLGSKYPQSTLPWSTPWRVIITGTDLGTIVESNLVTHLAEPCRLDDKSWIKPGKCSWSWWSNHSSARNYDILKSYVDLSAEMGWDYSLVDAEWDYMEGGNLEQLAEYAASKNVGLFVWYNSGGPHNKAKAMYRITDKIMQDFASENVFRSDEPEKLSPFVNQYYFDDVPYLEDIEEAIGRKLSEEMKTKILEMTFNPNATPRNKMHKRDVRRREFQKLQDMGIKGVKIDFFNSDKQDIIKLYLDIARDAADYHLLVNTHGCTIPRGWQRTYPNFISMEAVRGAELYSIASYPPRAVWLNALYPFTRNVIGSMDYTPVTFSDYSSETAHITTNAHELALSVIFECGVQHFADRKESYAAQPDYIKQFLSEVPVTWDETIFIDGYPGKYIILARRKGNTYYIAGINGEMKTRMFSFKMHFLSEKNQTFYVITDDGQPRKWKIVEYKKTKTDVFDIEILPAGGFVGIIQER